MKITLTLAPCFHVEVLSRRPCPAAQWPKPRRCPEKGCRAKDYILADSERSSRRGARRVVEIVTQRGER